MKRKLHYFFILLLPFGAYCQSIKDPLVGSEDNSLTRIINIEVTAKNTVVTFKSLMPSQGSWIQLSKGIYLQDATGEEKYNYITSEGITFAPVKTYATKDNEEKTFKVYFRKLKPGTKEINVIERAISASEPNTDQYFNYYHVSLTVSKLTSGYHSNTKTTNVILSPPPPMIGVDTTYKTNKSAGADIMSQNMAPMMAQMYTNMLDMQLKMYSDKAVLKKLAKITKDYYDELIKAGFSEEAALRIITSKQLISIGGQ